MRFWQDPDCSAFLAQAGFSPTDTGMLTTPSPSCVLVYWLLVLEAMAPDWDGNDRHAATLIEEVQVAIVEGSIAAEEGVCISHSAPCVLCVVVPSQDIIYILKIFSANFFLMLLLHPFLLLSLFTPPPQMHSVFLLLCSHVTDCACGAAGDGGPRCRYRAALLACSAFYLHDRLFVSVSVVFFT